MAEGPGNSRDFPDRDHLKRLSFVFAKNPLYFVTCCASRRKPVLVVGEAPSIIGNSFRDAAKVHGWTIGRYVIMPDHVHFFGRPTPNAKSLSQFIQDWKKWTARQLLSLGIEGVTSPVWQSEFFDHILRSAESYSEKWDYVRNNPVRAGSVKEPDDWRYKGEITALTF